MINELARVAAFSASASFGRDAYRYVKKREALALFVAGVFLTTYGFRHLVMGHDRGWFGTLFLTIIGSLLMVLTGLAFTSGALLILWTYVLQDTPGAPFTIIGILLAYLIISTAVGLIWGFRNRSARRQALAIERHNMMFLEANGFQDPGLGEEIIEDPDGHRLKLREDIEGQNRLVFSVVGRRNVRAAIELDDAGRMLSYTGAVRL